MNNWRHLGAQYLWNSFIANLSHSNNGLLKVVKHNPLFFLPFFILIIFVILLAVIFRLFFRIKKSVKEVPILLEITPPSHTEKTAYTTTQLFSTFHGLVREQTLLDKLLGKKQRLSFEIVSTKNEGIRYIIRTTPDQVNNVKKNLTTYLSDVSIKTVDDYLPKDFGKHNDYQTQIVEYRLGKSFAFPLQKQNQLEEHDPVGYITGMMTKLSPNELISFQIVLSPVKTSEVDIIQNMIRGKRDVLQYLGSPSYYLVVKLLFGIITLLTTIIREVGGALTSVISEVQSSPDQIRRMRAYELESKMRMNNFKNIPKVLTPYEEELIQSIQGKISQPLFTSSIKLLVIAKNKQELKERINGFNSSLSTFSDISNQSLKIKKGILNLKKIRIWLFKKRLISLFTSRNDRYANLLSSSEMSDLFHFPFTKVTRTEGLVKNRSRELPAPLSLKKSDAKFDVIIGENQYGGELVPIGITLEQRLKHMYIIGKTGMGKTTLITSAIYQDMLSGKGLVVFDPHGDMIQELLKVIPKNRKNDVIFFDPSDREWPIGLNLLSPGIKFNNIEDEHDWITSSVLAVFKKLADEKHWGPRMEHILRNATLTALLTPNPNIYTIQRLLTDKAYQRKIALTLRDPVLKQFWQKEFALMGNMQLSSVTAPLTQRLGNFISSKMSRHILLQEKSGISISQIMDEGKILLINLSKGDLGEDQSFFFGTILTSFIWMAAYQRTKIPENKRKDFFIYVDEFQNFATPQFSEISSEGRKFHISLIASHQNIAQIKDKDILKGVAGNANTIVCFKDSPDDEAFILPFMDPEVEKGDIVNLAPFHFFMKVTGVESEEAFSGKNVPIDVTSSEKTRDEIISYTRDHYATPRAKVEQYLEKLFEEDKPKSVKAEKAKEVISATKTNSKRKNKKSIKVKTTMVKKPARRK
jgi:hypothetical protein